MEAQSAHRPDPGAATTPAEFLEALKRLRTWCGQPSLRTITKLAGRIAVPNRPPADVLPVSTVSDNLAGKRLPNLPRESFVDAFVGACMRSNGHDEAGVTAEIAAWRTARQALATATEPAPATPAPATPVPPTAPIRAASFAATSGPVVTAVVPPPAAAPTEEIPARPWNRLRPRSATRRPESARPAGASWRHRLRSGRRDRHGIRRAILLGLTGAAALVVITASQTATLTTATPPTHHRHAPTAPHSTAPTTPPASPTAPTGHPSPAGGQQVNDPQGDNAGPAPTTGAPNAKATPPAAQKSPSGYFFCVGDPKMCKDWQNGTPPNFAGTQK